jgi:hypothetical protein
MVVMSPYVLWPIPSDSALRRYFWNWGLCGHCADCRNVRLRPRHALLTGGDPRNSSGSLAILAAMRRALLRRNSNVYLRACCVPVNGVNKLGTLTTRFFQSWTRGFCAPEDASVAVCVLPGTELSFVEDVRRDRLWPWSKGAIKHRTAIFRQINKEVPSTHHDALEFPDGKIVLLTFLEEGQRARVLQLPVTKEGARVSEPDKAKA